MFLLRYRRAARFGPHLDNPVRPNQPNQRDLSDDRSEDEAALRLDGHCEEIAELEPALFFEAEEPETTELQTTTGPRARSGRKDCEERAP